ncbi:hypothetical protein [Bradyrhizobium algeriense]|uniref:hypothetical protein n=1 Tax=Bradyrhizobium algeriense TaxID=634784 RepID=UPI0011AE5654|nr:hypothetical protein [Bradyrhizobium algeriense]
MQESESFGIAGGHKRTRVLGEMASAVAASSTDNRIGDTLASDGAAHHDYFDDFTDADWAEWDEPPSDGNTVSDGMGKKIDDRMERLAAITIDLPSQRKARSGNNAQANGAETSVLRGPQAVPKSLAARRNALLDAHDMEQRDGKEHTSETVGLPGRNGEEVAGVRENESRRSASVHEGRRSRGLRERANTGAASPRAHSRIHGVRAFDGTMLDDYFSNFTDADWAKWDELNTASLDKGKAKIDVQMERRSAITIDSPGQAMPRSSGRGEGANTVAASSSGASHIGGTPASEAHHDYLRDFTDADWAECDELLREVEAQRSLDKGKAKIDVQMERPAAITIDAPGQATPRSSGRGEGANTVAASSSGASHVGGTPASEAHHDYLRDFTDADWAECDELLRKVEAQRSFDKGKAKIDDQMERPDAITSGLLSQETLRSSTGQTIECIEIGGDNLLIGHESEPKWNHAMLFETPQQHYRRTGRWLTKNEYDIKSVLIKIGGPGGSYVPRSELYLRLGPRGYGEAMDMCELSRQTFSERRTDGPLSFETPGGRRTCLHNYRFPRQAGTFNPDILIQNDSGGFVGIWPKLNNVTTLASLTRTFGAKGVWLKGADNTYMTERAYNLRVPEGAEGAFAKFIAGDDASQFSRARDDRKRGRGADMGR